MATQKNSLQAVLEQQARGPTAATPPQASVPAKAPKQRAQPKRAPKTASAPEPEAARFFRPSREGRKLIAGHFDPKVAKQLKLLAAEEETTVQALLEEALNLLFVKKGRGVIDRA